MWFEIIVLQHNITQYDNLIERVDNVHLLNFIYLILLRSSSQRYLTISLSSSTALSHVHIKMIESSSGVAWGISLLMYPMEIILWILDILSFGRMLYCGIIPPETGTYPIHCWWLISPIENYAKSLKNDCNPGIWVLIWEYSVRAF